MTACPTLETERLIMRPFRDDDLNSYAAMMDTPELRESLRIPDGKGGLKLGSKWLGGAVSGNFEELETGL